MTDQIPYIRVFISSPGDVNDERKIALDVIEQFPYRASFRDKVAFRIVAWDKRGAGTPMRATLTPQDAINQGLPMPSECDIVIVLFWSRMGTPFVHSDGVEYQSGTYWELMDALEADRPETVIYRRTEEPSFKPSDPKFDNKVAQYNKVDTFFKSKLFYDADGRIQRGINMYDKPDDFRSAFTLDFEVLVLDILKRFEQNPDTYDDSDLPDTANIETKATETWNPDRSPFPGLRAFTEADADIFFGRGAETDALISQLTDNRFVAVIASSGSGKSSLVGAGLIPRLRVNAIQGSKDWKIARFTPAENPFDGLFNAMVTAFPQLKPNPLEARRIKNNFIDDMRDDPQALLDICTDLLADEDEWVEFLLFIDQFEELFTLSNRNDAQAFVNLLNIIANDSRIRVVVTMRADFYQSALVYPKLADLLRRGSFPLAIPRELALRQMIESPAERAKITFEDGLIDHILSEVGDEPGNLALMAYALDELYTLDDDGILTFAEYESLGGVRGAIGTRADNIWAALNLDDSVLHGLFLQLIEVNEHGVATRRRADIQTEDSTDDTTRLMNAFTAARLLTMDYNDETETATVEVAHEAILREWHTLRDWIDKQSANFRIVARMRRDAQWWASNGKREQDLPRAEQTDEFFEACNNLGLTITAESEPLLAEFAQDERERLIQSLATGDIDAATRDFVFYRLRQIGGDMIAANLAVFHNQDISQDDYEDTIRVHAIKVLGKSKDKRNLQLLINALNDRDYRVREASVTFLSRLGAKQAIDTLIQALTDDEHSVRSASAKSLGELGDKRAVEPLIQALADDKDSVRLVSAKSLGELGDKRAVEPLIQALENALKYQNNSHFFRQDTRVQFIRELGKLGDKRAVEPLIQALSDRDYKVRSASALALGQLGAKQAVEPLIQALKDKLERVRAASAFALGQLRDKRAVEPLIQALNDEEISMRANSIIALHALDPSLAVVNDFDDEKTIRHMIEQLDNPFNGITRKHPVNVTLRAMKHPLAQDAVAQWDAEHADDATADDLW